MKQRMAKKINKGKCKYGLFLCVILSIFLLTGCFPKGYTREEAKSQVKIGKEIFIEYLDENYEGAKIKEVEVHDQLSEDREWLLTDYVEGVFEYEDNYYLFVVNIRTEEIYTSVEYDTFVEACEENMVDELEIEYDAMECTDFSYELSVAATDDSEHALYGVNTSIGDVFPVGIDMKEYAREQLASEDCQITMELSYSGDVMLADYNFNGKEVDTFPGVSFVWLKHLRDSSYIDNYSRDYHYDILESKYTEWNPEGWETQINTLYDYMCLETMTLNGGMEYREWKEYELEGFTICYSCAYVEEGFVYDEETEEYTEEVVSNEYLFQPEKDFTVDVSEEYIFVELPEDSEMIYYIYIDDMDLVNSYEEVVFCDEARDDYIGYKQREWTNILGQYVLTDVSPYECDANTIGRFYYGECGKKLYKDAD